jgi:hypothetical protein
LFKNTSFYLRNLSFKRNQINNYGVLVIEEVLICGIENSIFSSNFGGQGAAIYYNGFSGKRFNKIE